MIKNYARVGEKNERTKRTKRTKSLFINACMLYELKLSALETYKNRAETYKNVQKEVGFMNLDKKTCCISMDRDIRHKLLVIYTVKKRFFDEETTISGIVNQALSEYFRNHNDEIDKMMNEYKEQGGCLKL